MLLRGSGVVDVLSVRISLQVVSAVRLVRSSCCVKHGHGRKLSILSVRISSHRLGCGLWINDRGVEE
jgi:hypothetical protein